MGYAAGIRTDTYIGGLWTPAAAGPGKQLATAFSDDPATQRLAGYVVGKADGKKEDGEKKLTLKDGQQPKPNEENDKGVY
ncbi:MAG: hypothetical protein PHG97_02340 [Candidatus Margulisbacteria bacterium]|nr:hypothetical protein [Candidatus Margulisiibacteriota bacterium]